MKTESIAVEVTRKDIRQGRASDTTACPIALALTRAGFAGVVVGGISGFGYDGNGQYVEILLPESAARFQDQFDWGYEVDPVVFPATVVPRRNRRA